jgi:hypothetical protein
MSELDVVLRSASSILLEDTCQCQRFTFIIDIVNTRIERCLPCLRGWIPKEHVNKKTERSYTPPSIIFVLVYSKFSKPYARAYVIYYYRGIARVPVYTIAESPVGSSRDCHQNQARPG